MFKLKQLPDRETLVREASALAHLDPVAMEACYLLMRAGSDLLDDLTGLCRVHDLNQAQFLVLHVLRNSPEQRLTPSEIVERVSVTHSSASAIIDHLEKRRFVERKLCQRDRRKVFVNLTRGGAKVVEEILMGHWGRFCSFLGSMDASELAGFTASLRKIMHSGDEQGDAVCAPHETGATEAMA